MGGCSGSTSGGIKVMRIQILIKYIYRELLRIMHPNIVMDIKMNKRHLEEDIIFKIISFLLIHFLVIAISVLLVSIETKDFLTALSSVLASTGNIGPAFGNVGPLDTFSSLGNLSKLVLSLDMLMGRLELFTVIILFIPRFWKRT